MKIRIVNTASKVQMVQLVQCQNNKRRILQHIGLAHSQDELNELLLMAEEWIKSYSTQLSIFFDENPDKMLHLNHCKFIGVRYRFFYEQISKLHLMLGLGNFPTLLCDLVIIRIFEPASKLRSLELLEQLFNIRHRRKSYYKIEQAFRISKSDLQARPIFHFKEEPIKLHILICFIALVFSKHIELRTGILIRRFVDESK